MKHYFIINPIAGGKDSTGIITKELERVNEEYPFDYKIFITKNTHDATDIVESLCRSNEATEQPEDIVFYACGGDGTCFEVVNGLANYKHALFSIIPVGSCNDFLKSFPEYDFTSIEKIIKGKMRILDLLHVNDYYSLNVCNIGFDAKVNYDCVNNRDKYKTIKQSYNAAIIKNLLRPWGDKVEVLCDGKPFFTGKALLMSYANGGFYGGGYHCAPYFKCDDGFLDVGIIKKISRFTFASMIKSYRKGTHYQDRRAPKIMMHKYVKKAVVKADKPLTVTIDGETFFWTEVNIEIVPKAIRFIFPQK